MATHKHSIGSNRNEHCEGPKQATGVTDFKPFAAGMAQRGVTDVGS
jgi:hypothetical protein